MLKEAKEAEDSSVLEVIEENDVLTNQNKDPSQNVVKLKE